jgi:raffinose/stachyose/melibiose transport system substrate-binding protein
MTKRHLILSILFMVALVISMGTVSAASQVTLTVSTNVVGNQAKVLQTIAENFQKENPDIKIDFSALGGAYENAMKVKMASNDMPDVFSTHGWAITRYGKYLLDLRNEPWASKVAPAIKPLVTDEKGMLYVLPMDQDLGTFTYAVDIFKQYGIQVPTTMDELMAVCATIKAKSNGKVTPIHLGAADQWPIGQYYDMFGVSAFLSPQNNDAKALLDGTVNWKKYDILSAKLLKMKQKGYLNVDASTAKYTDSAKALAEGKAAITFQGAYIIDEAQKTNPKFNGGIMPVPAIVKGDAPNFSGGERTTYGIWKDSKNIDAAKKFLAYSAKAENVAAVAESNMMPAGLSGVKVNLGTLTPFYEKYSNIRIFPYFDRVYLPGGMWDVMYMTGQELLAGTMTPSQVSEKMASEYKRLRAAQK